MQLHATSVLPRDNTSAVFEMSELELFAKENVNNNKKQLLLQADSRGGKGYAERRNDDGAAPEGGSERPANDVEGVVRT